MAAVSSQPGPTAIEQVIDRSDAARQQISLTRKFNGQNAARLEKPVDALQRGKRIRDQTDGVDHCYEIESVRRDVIERSVMDNGALGRGSVVRQVGIRL